MINNNNNNNYYYYWYYNFEFTRIKGPPFVGGDLDVVIASVPESGSVEFGDVPAVDESVVGRHDVAVDVEAHLDGAQDALVRVLSVDGQEGEGSILRQLIFAQKDFDGFVRIPAVEDVAELLPVDHFEHRDQIVPHLDIDIDMKLT